MRERAFSLNEKVKNSQNEAKILGESFQLERGLLDQLGPAWHLEAYTDAHKIEHIHVFRQAETDDADSDQWEILVYADEEAPLELLMLPESM